MITNPFAICFLIIGATLLALAALSPFIVPLLTRAWRRATPFGRFTFILGLTISLLFGGTKTNSVDTAGTTNEVSGSSSLLMTFAPPPLINALTVADFELVSVTTNENPSCALPPNGQVRGTWHLTGTFDDVRNISLDGFEFPLGSNLCTSLWAYTSGKIRPQLANASNEVVAVGAPMSAIPGLSRLWTSATSNDSYLLTWENFALGRIATSTNTSSLIPHPSSLVSAQLELKRNGDFITRSNEVERLYHRRVPGTETEGYGPHQQLEVEECTNAYYAIDLVVFNADARVTFTGNGSSNLPDPNFIARAGETNHVELLIGKTYTIRCDMPFGIIGTSDWRVEVIQHSRNAATVVWPVDIYMDYGIAPLMGPLHAPLLGAGNGGPRLRVDPDWLNGTLSMPTNVCCGVSGTGGEFEFACNGDCGCGGCTIRGTYTYEGYSISFGGWTCGCVPHEGENYDYSTYGISVPEVVFKDGALRALNVWFDPGEDDDNSGQLVLTPTQGQNKIRIWADEHKMAQASQFSWPVAAGVNCTYYIEGVETSDSVDDIEFKLEWVKEDGPDPEYSQMTCAEVKETQVASLTDGITDGSPNQQPFDGHTNWEFNVTHSPNPDKHFAVLFRDVVNDDFSVRDFSVRMTLIVQPTGAPVGSASWFALDPTPSSGEIVSTGTCFGELRNPKVGGVYHIGSCFDGSPTNECNIVLPLAGAAVEDILLEDLARADEFAAFVCSHLDEKQINTIQFGLYFFWDAGRGDYLGRPDNLDFPTVWNYNQVTTSGRQFGKGAVATLFGLPIRISKLSNLLAAYACDRLGVYQELQNLSQWIGTRNDDSSLISWNCGTALAHGSNYVHSVSNMARQCWGSSDTKAARLWPNASAADNHAAAVYYGDVERFFYSPGMLHFLHN